MTVTWFMWSAIGHFANLLFVRAPDGSSHRAIFHLMILKERKIAMKRILTLTLAVLTVFSLLLMLSAHLTGKVTGKKRRKLSIYVSAALALAAAFACGKSAFDMYMLSDVLVPAVNFVFWIVLPLLFLCAAAVKRARRKREKSA